MVCKGLIEKIERCIECGGKGIKVHKEYGEIMCVCLQRHCLYCNGEGIFESGMTCWNCDGHGYQVLHWRS